MLYLSFEQDLYGTEVPSLLTPAIDAAFLETPPLSVLLPLPAKGEKKQARGAEFEKSLSLPDNELISSGRLSHSFFIGWVEAREGRTTGGGRESALALSPGLNQRQESDSPG